ncbi:unnamed protein product [Macrosiphum euphorbiae]|uniref:Secreted protein n=1 Tax=Macrosiphum euphorbiae TaxID=13131 RepID=A0AAV0WE40_9HEMI|nr:unnamed protein product [Macrosiphum euphorbiae]
MGTSTLLSTVLALELMQLASVGSLMEQWSIFRWNACLRTRRKKIQTHSASGWCGMVLRVRVHDKNRGHFQVLSVFSHNTLRWADEGLPC